MQEIKHQELGKKSLEIHEKYKGKIEVRSKFPVNDQLSLSLAYTPGVAEPCNEIAKNKDNVFKYTSRGNLVAVVTDGTAVLGLGDIGPEAALPVMEGKAVLFKEFANVDAFPICLNTKNTEKIIECVKAIAPTFGGINLEDISSPRCFEIEKALKAELDIPVFHDDQHGTAIISLAGLMNAIEIVNKKIDKIKVVFNGAGAAGIACARFYRSAGVKNLILCDTKGVIHSGRQDLNIYKKEFAVDTDARTLSDAMKDADVFCGVSVGNCVTKEMVSLMADNPLIFAMANPDPEIMPEEAFSARKDIIMATGRSDYPNQVNNVLGFPFIFRGALDVRASDINEEMKLAASNALAKLAREPVPKYIEKAYGGKHFEFGPEYIIPKPFDRRVLVWESCAVAEAAIKSGVAKRKINIEEYSSKLEQYEKRGWQQAPY